MQTKTGKAKRAIEDIDDPTKDELYTNVSKMSEPYRSCAAFLYLTGNRVSEVLGIPSNDKHRELDTCVWVVKPMRRYDIELLTIGTSRIMRAKTRTLKRKGRPTHTYTTRIDMPEEQRYFEFIKPVLDATQPQDYIWNFSRFKLWRHLNHHTTLPPHKLRGLRATRDAVEFELDAIDLKQKFNWKNSDMPFHYASKSTHDIEQKLMRKK